MIEHKGISWRKYQGALIPDIDDQPIVVTEEDARELLKKSGAYLLRWISDFDTKHETDFWYVIKDSSPDLDKLSSNTRSKVRRGLKNCNIKKVKASFIAENAYQVYSRAYERYEAGQTPIEERSFSDDIMKTDPDVWDFWAVFDRNDEIVAYSQNRRVGNHCIYTTIKFVPEALKLYSSYALFYEMNNYYLNILHLAYVNDGARCIHHQTNIQGYLIDKFHFRKAYSVLHIAYRADIGILLALLYPFRSMIREFQSTFMKRLSSLLLQEQIRRNCAN